MKKLFSFLLLSVGILAAPQIMAQKILTSKTVIVPIGYSIVDRNEKMTIYKYLPVADSTRRTENHVSKYFFTTPASDVLQPMTLANLKKAFPKKQPFAAPWSVSYNN
ncbi:MAG: hypothetical protein JJE22_18150 [Bacteroidia bacterium]|nr:hypothetical protein [Bacteroidia bacterium]